MKKSVERILPKLPQSIINYYKQYENKNPVTKAQILMGTKFEIDGNFEVVDIIGQGAYGIVIAAQDKRIKNEENNLIAIKKIEKAFEHKVFTKRTLRELKILRVLSHDNISTIESILLPRSRQDFEDIYLVSELMETDLTSIIKSPQPLSDEHCQFFLYQILRGMKYVHSAGIVHRDLKPRNLLVNTNCDLRICDFGLARTINNDPTQIKSTILTDYVATRWYRAPELLLCSQEYNESIDMWSIGCIFAELLLRKPFLPGQDTKHQLSLIFDVIGTPSLDEINEIPREKSRKYVASLLKKPTRQLNKIFTKASPIALDLLKKMLIFNPKKRITIQEALNHPYLEALHCPEDEPLTTKVNPLEFEFENYNLTLEQLKDLIYEEILLYHSKEFKEQYYQKLKNKQSLIIHVLNNENKNSPEDADDEYESDF